MRLWIVALPLIWGLIACTPRGFTPQPSPTGSPVEITVDDTQLSLLTATGWQSYTSRDRIVLSYEDGSSENVSVNIWIPDLDLSTYGSITEVAFDIADTMEDEQDLSVTQPTSILWNQYESVYFLVRDDSPNTSMIIVSQTAEEQAIALHIRGIETEFSQLRQQLETNFASFSVDGQLLGGEIFASLPDTLMLPSLNPEAALDPSAEP